VEGPHLQPALVRCVLGVVRVARRHVKLQLLLPSPSSLAVMDPSLPSPPTPASPSRPASGIEGARVAAAARAAPPFTSFTGGGRRVGDGARG
jgi:hypothetical protein